MENRHNDQYLLERFRETGDEGAFLLLYSRHLPSLRKRAAKILDGDHAAAEDIVQQAFADLAHESGESPSPRNLASWLSQCVTNAALNLRRSAKRRSRREEEYAELARPATSPAGCPEKIDAVRRLIDNLDPLDAQAILARHVEGLSYEEVSRRYGFPSPDAGRKRIRRAIDHLRLSTPIISILAAVNSTARGARLYMMKWTAGAGGRITYRSMLWPGGACFCLGLCFWLARDSTAKQMNMPGSADVRFAGVDGHPRPLSYIPPSSGTVAPAGGTGTTQASATTTGGAGILAHWKFDTVSADLTFDEISRNPARAEGGLVTTAGRNGRGAIRVIRGAGLEVADARFLNASSRSGAVSISFWQQNEGTIRSSSFFGASRNSSDRRGIQAHVPWEDGRIYWDTSGKERLVADPSSLFPDWDWSDRSWHHYAFVKDGDIHRLWLDGVLLTEGLAGDLPKDFTSLWIGGNDGKNPVPNPGAMDDFAVFSGPLRRDQVRLLASGKSPDSVLADHDRDQDGLPDSYETDHGLDPSRADSAADADADGLTNLQEFHLGTDPNSADSDADGLSDAVETGTGLWISRKDTGTQPLIADTDQDGLPDGAETNSGYFISLSNTGTHPLERDSDHDGCPDRSEIVSQTDPLDPSSSPIKGPLPALAAYWDFDSPTDPWRDLVSGAGAIPGESNRLIQGAKGGALRVGAKLGLRVPKSSFQSVAGSLDTLVITFWLKGAECSKGCAVFAESPSSEGMIGLRIHAPWKNGEIIFDTPRQPQYRGSSRGAVSTEFMDPAWSWKKKQWHHFVFSKHGREKQIWLDGERVFSGEAGPLPEDLADLWIGSDPGGHGIPGMLDDFAIFLSPLSENHITLLARGTRPDQLDIPATPAIR
ncbi:sigma-70 family RNA polymerase sigma factor [Luteolibacter yonseiensis]|uniref:Sigma-70 family RNA polymerase sigma factor n=2 Tax=Luteolibacter yonseiensis TaxID=1144680 RepID=A0A934R016_9BACT|nr:sigma-70 family RNA polymerase sigma factor [Luteolibacter yonseiensis]MBK1814212.1 sigma-70 family RNA polymerase sigma factor [Luteolibacter yonseiensis]